MTEGGAVALQKENMRIPQDLVFVVSVFLTLAPRLLNSLYLSGLNSSAAWRPEERLNFLQFPDALHEKAVIFTLFLAAHYE